MASRSSILTKLIFLVTIPLSVAALGSDCSVSREFEVRHSQVVRGAMQDPEGRALSGNKIELLSSKQVLRSLLTDNLGIYDFGEIPAGKYQVQVHAFAFCAPQVVCKAQGCSFISKLKLKPRAR